MTDRLHWRKFFWLMASTLTGAVLVYLADLGAVWSRIQEVKILYLIPAFFLGNLSLLIHSFGWKKAFSRLEFDLKFIDYFRLNLSGLFIHNITPLADLGSQPFIAGLIQRYGGGNYEEVLSTLVAVDMTFLLPTYALGLFIGFFVINPYLFILLVPLAVLIYFLYSYSYMIDGLIDFLDRSTGFGLLERYQNSRRALREFMENRYNVAMVLGLGFLPPLLESLSVYFLVLGVSAEITLLAAATLIPLTRLSGMFPTPGGSGAYEVVLTALLVEIGGLNLSAAVTVTVLYRIITYYFGILIGYISLVSLPIGRSGERTGI